MIHGPPWLHMRIFGPNDSQNFFLSNFLHKKPSLITYNTSSLFLNTSFLYYILTLD